MELPAAPHSSRSPKRPRSPSSTPCKDQKKPRAPSPNDDVRDDTLRIVTQMLRDENRQLLADRDALEQSKTVLTERLAQTKQTIRDLEDDVARLYRQKQKEMDAQRSDFEQKLQEVTAATAAGAKDFKEISNGLLYSQQTTAEIHRFLQSCELWQKKLQTVSGQLQVKAENVQAQEVQGVVKDLVTSIEMQALRNELESSRDLLQWVTWLQEGTSKYLKERDRDRQETEGFEAIEKQLMDDRVVELETQLAQKRAVEREKEMELSSLRAVQEELIHSSHVVPNEEFETLVAEKKRMEEEQKDLKKKMEEQRDELKSVRDENAALKQHNEKLVQETRQMREKREKSEFEAVQQSLTQVEERKKLQAQLQAFKAREAKLTAVLTCAEKEMEKSKQRKEELNIVYAKFSSAMDSFLEKTMRVEELEQELKDAQSNARDSQVQKQELEKQIIQLQQEKMDLSTAQRCKNENLRQKLAQVQQRYTVLKELESQQKDLASQMQAEIAELKAQNATLKEEQIKQEHQSVGQPSNEGGKRDIDSENTLVVQVAEKEALQMFMQRYYSAAEEKCSRLLEKVSKLESEKSSLQEHTKESCSVLRVCADSCDESVRASLLDVMATLEGLT